MTARKIALAVFVVSLILSVSLNIVLARRFSQCYRQLQMVRLDPAMSGVLRTEDGVPDHARNEPLVILLGDSRISQWSPSPSVSGCRVINHGVNGQTTALCLLRLEKDVLASHPRAVVMQIGVNDLKLIGLFPDRKRFIVDSCWRNIRQLVDRITAQDIDIVILTIFPPGPVGLLRRSVWSREIDASIEEINARLLGLAGPGITVVDCDPVLKPAGRLNREYARDTLHLTPSAYEALNHQVAPILQQLTQE